MFDEPSKIVDLLLQLMARQNHPDLRSVDFNTFELLTEAVEKYEVFAYKQECKSLMQ
jgi:hypothetical protein